MWKLCALFWSSRASPGVLGANLNSLGVQSGCAGGQSGRVGVSLAVLALWACWGALWACWGPNMVVLGRNHETTPINLACYTRDATKLLVQFDVL